MSESSYLEIKEKYIEIYPHLDQIKSRNVFAQNALRLAVPETVTGIELLELSAIC